LCCSHSRTSFFSSDLNPLVSSGSTSFRRNCLPSRMRYGFTSFFASLIFIYLRQWSEVLHSSVWKRDFIEALGRKKFRVGGASRRGEKNSPHCPPTFCVSHRREHPQTAAPSPRANAATG